MLAPSRRKMLLVAVVSLVSVAPLHWSDDASLKAQAPGPATWTYAPVQKAVALPAGLRSVYVHDVSLSPDGALLAATGRKASTKGTFVDSDEPVPTIVLTQNHRMEPCSFRARRANDCVSLGKSGSVA
jgi:hypothetical protein